MEHVRGDGPVLIFLLRIPRRVRWGGDAMNGLTSFPKYGPRRLRQSRERGLLRSSAGCWSRSNAASPRAAGTRGVYTMNWGIRWYVVDPEQPETVDV
ncbi:hypothetical protein BD779DRAFT_1152938 [Infundibulicybe gibba]|nr:hypothetical protein BD779DRAFT_1152938 [Infundibulicybe gibba]